MSAGTDPSLVLGTARAYGLALAVSGADGLGARIGARISELGASVVELGVHDGALDGVVHVAALGSVEDRVLNDTDRVAWDRRGEAPLRVALAAMQAAFAALADRGGAIVLVIPSIALTGAAGLVPSASASEGIRLMGKSAARAWGSHGVRVNCVTAPVAEWGIVQSPGHEVPSKFGPSLGDRDLAADVAGAAVYLCSPLSAGVTGATIGIDRGELLAP